MMPIQTRPLVAPTRTRQQVCRATAPCSSTTRTSSGGRFVVIQQGTVEVPIVRWVSVWGESSFRADGTHSVDYWAMRSRMLKVVRLAPNSSTQEFHKKPAESTTRLSLHFMNSDVDIFTRTCTPMSCGHMLRPLIRGTVPKSHQWQRRVRLTNIKPRLSLAIRPSRCRVLSRSRWCSMIYLGLGRKPRRSRTMSVLTRIPMGTMTVFTLLLACAS